MYDDDLADEGYVMNLTRVWAHDPAAHEAFWAAVTQVSTPRRPRSATASPGDAPPDELSG